MRETVKLYYELRKIWIWTLLAIITIIAISSMVFNIGGWYQAKHTFDSHFDAHHYYEIRDYAQSLVGTKQANKVMEAVNNQRAYEFIDNTPIKHVSKNDQLAYYILTISPHSVGADNHHYKQMISLLPETFSQFRHRVLSYYQSVRGYDPNAFSSYNMGPSLFVAGLPVAKQIYLPVTAKSSNNSGPFNHDGFKTHTWTFNQPLGLGSVLLAIAFGAIFFLLDQIHWINPYMLQRSRNGRIIAVAKSFWWFVLPGFLACFYAFIEFVVKSFAIPAEFIHNDYGLFFSNLVVVLVTGFSITAFGLLIDSFIGTVFGKIYTVIASMMAFILALANAQMVVSVVIHYWHLHPSKQVSQFFDNAINGNANGFSWAELLLACVMLLLSLFWYKKYSYDTDSHYVRQPNLKKPFFYFVIALAIWDFILPIVLSHLAGSDSYFRDQTQISSIIWWLAWGIGITVFTGWLIFRKPLKFSFLRRKN